MFFCGCVTINLYNIFSVYVETPKYQKICLDLQTIYDSSLNYIQVVVSLHQSCIFSKKAGVGDIYFFSLVKSSKMIFQHIAIEVVWEETRFLQLLLNQWWKINQEKLLFKHYQHLLTLQSKLIWIIIKWSYTDSWQSNVPWNVSFTGDSCGDVQPLALTQAI